MCATCGCGDGEHQYHHDADHHHEHSHEVGSDARAPRILRLERAILDENDRAAERNRAWLDARGVVAVNVMGSPGAGKTTLLERAVSVLGASRRGTTVSVIEGDQATRRDAERMERAGVRVAQINTGAGCHLDARMIAGVLDALSPPARSLLVVENVGNLVCPALFALGERARAVVLSVAEGDDKPQKYPHMFRTAHALVLSKIDLLPHVDFDVERCVAEARRFNPELRVFPLSAKSGEGVPAFCRWLLDELSRGGGGGGSRA